MTSTLKVLKIIKNWIKKSNRSIKMCKILTQMRNRRGFRIHLMKNSRKVSIQHIFTLIIIRSIVPPNKTSM